MSGGGAEPTGLRPRRRFAISLRASMLLVLVVGGLIGWKARRASLQRRAVAAIQRLGGSTQYDWEAAHDWRSDPDPASVPGPAWLRRIIGDEYFQEVAVVSLAPFRDQPDQPIEQSAYRKLKREFDADQLACLDGLEGIEHIELWSTGLGPEGAARLGRLARLKNLALSGAPLGAEALAHLGKLTDLETLFISVEVGDARSLAFLDRLPKLTMLIIWDGPVSDDGLAVIGRRERLEILSIDGAKLTDAGLAHLRGMRRLTSLRIDSAFGFTEEGLSSLPDLPDLRGLILQGRGVSKPVLARLRARPGLQVDVLP